MGRNKTVLNEDGTISLILFDKQGNNVGSAILDIVDYDLIKDLKWHRHKGSSTDYVATNLKIDGKYKIIKMHRFLTGVTDPKVEVDHIDHNGLNNVRSNLRVGCKSDNQKNHKIRSDNKSGYIGVSWNSIKNKWVAQIQNNNVKIHIGYFNSEIDAAKAYDKICQTEHGEYAVLNFQGD